MSRCVLEQGVYISRQWLREVSDVSSAAVGGIRQRFSDEHQLSARRRHQNSKCSVYPCIVRSQNLLRLSFILVENFSRKMCRPSANILCGRSPNVWLFELKNGALGIPALWNYHTTLGYCVIPSYESIGEWDGRRARPVMWPVMTDT